ncbi:MAG: hypothetical protein WBO04_05945 [Steroidobacteraceae bacterium]
MNDPTGLEELEEAPAHLAPAAARAYLDARMQGLCHEGALEVAEGIQKSLPANAAPCAKSPAS